MATKHDQQKLRMDLIPTAAERAIARALGYGAIKYSDYNYDDEGGLEYNRLYGAARRHLADWWDRKEPDDESGLSHLDHALACLAMLADYEEYPDHYGDLDNRRKRDRRCKQSKNQTGAGRKR